MTVILSLFDGCAITYEALKRAGIYVSKYYASEIDKYATVIAMKNHPDIVQLGDITNWKNWNIDWSEITYIVGGSPCQGFSFAGKQLNFNDDRSKLFFVYSEILNHVQQFNPNVIFLLENVKMKQEHQNVITNHLRVEPIFIDSNLVSAQNRKRLYWTNIPGVKLPEDKGILLKDIVHENCFVDREKSRAILASIGRTTHREYFEKNQGQMVFDFANEFILPLSEKEIEYMLRGNSKWGQAGDCRFENYLQYPDEKSFTVTANIHKGVPYNCYFEKLSEYIVPFDETLQVLDKEVEQGKMGYFRKDSQANRVYYIHDKAVTLCGCAGGGAAKMGQYLFGTIILGKKDGKRFFTLTTKDKQGVLIEGYIRKLTPIECERLQTLPDNYTFGVSNTQRYKMLGNGFTTDVISHILTNSKTCVIL